MAITTAQKQAWLISQGKPKSYSYFMTGPNLGPDWDWNKAINGGYSSTEINGFISTGETKYKAHKKTSGKKKPAGNPKNPVTTPGASCAKTAAKTIENAVSAARQIALDWYSNRGTFYFSAAADAYKSQGVLTSSTWIKQIDDEIKKVIELVGDKSDEVIAMRQLRILMKQADAASDSESVLLSLSNGLTHGDVDGVAVDLGQLAKAAESWGQEVAVDKAALLLGDVWNNTESVLKQTSQGAAATIARRNQAAVGRVWKTLQENGLTDELFDFPALSGYSSTDAGIAIRQWFMEFDPPYGNSPADFSWLALQQERQAAALNVWNTYFKSTPYTDEEIFALMGQLSKDVKKNIGAAIDKAYEFLGDDQMLSFWWWSGNGKLSGSPIELYAKQFGADAKAGLFGQVEQLQKATKSYGSSGAMSESISDHFVNSLEYKKTGENGLSDVFDAVLDSNKKNLPGFTPTKQDVLDALNPGYVKQITDANTDELNAIVQAKLTGGSIEGLGALDQGVEVYDETKSLAYYMTKEQKIDFILLPKETFDQQTYVITWKSKGVVHELQGDGLGVAKQKYAIKNGAIPKPAPSTTTNAAGVNPVTQQAVAPKQTIFTKNKAKEVLDEYDKAVAPPGKPKWYSDGEKITDPQDALIKQLLVSKPQATKEAFIDAHLVDALDGKVLSKGQASDLITFLKQSDNITVDEFKAVASYQPMPGMTSTPITDLADAVVKKLDIDADDIAVATSAAITETGPAATAAKDVVTSAAPSHWGKGHTFTYKGDARQAGGWHRKWWYTDEEGHTWLLKNADPIYRAEAEHAAHELTYMVGMDVSESKVVYQATEGLQQKGFLQRLFTDTADDLEGLGVNTADDIAAALTQQQLDTLQDYQVIDWLMGNMDTHSGNFIVLNDGRIVAIDKGQAFKYFGSESLSRTSSQAGNTGHNTYNEMWRAYVDGKIEMNLDRVDEMLRKIEQLSEDEVRRVIAPYAKGRFPKSSADTFTKYNTEEDFIQAVLDRKRTIRQDFEKFYGDLAEDRGAKWTPRWATADKLPDVPAKGPYEILTPVDEVLVKQIEATGALGRSVYVSGADVERGQILFDVVTDKTTGKKVLRVNLKLRQSADKRFMDLARSEGLTSTSGQVAPSIVSLPKQARDAAEWVGKVQGGAKTVNHHISAGDFTPNADRITATKQALADIDQVLIAAKKGEIVEDITDDLVLKLSQYDDENLYLHRLNNAAADMTQVEAAKYYEAPAREIVKQAEAGTAALKVPKVDSFDVEASFKRNRAELEARVQKLKGDTPHLVDVSEPETVFKNGTVRVTEMKSSYIEKPSIATPLDATVDGEIGFQYNGWQHVAAETSDGMSVRYRPITELSSDVYHKGWMEMSVPLDGEPSPEDIQKVLDFLRHRVGVEMDMANSRDMELLYWRMHVGVMKESKEFADTSSKFYIGVTAAERRVSQLPIGHSVEEEITALKEGFREGFGDVVDKADTLPIHKRLVGRGDTVEGTEFGYGVTEAFYVYDQDFEQVFDNIVILHGTRDVRGKGLTANYFDGPSGEGLVPRELKQQIGANVERGYAKDEFGSLGSGGSPGWFARLRGSGRTGTASTEGYIVHPRVFRELGQYNGSNDEFGRLSSRKVKNHLVAAKYKQGASGSNEFVGRSYATFEDDIPLISVGDDATRDKIIMELKARGVHSWDGVAVEERVFNYNKVDPLRYWREFRQKHGIDLNEPLRKSRKTAGSFQKKVREVLDAGVSRLKNKEGVITTNISSGRALIDARVRLIDPISGVGRYVTAPTKIHAKENAISFPQVWVEKYNLQSKSGGKFLRSKNEIGYKWGRGQTVQDDVGYVFDVSQLGFEIKNLSKYQQSDLVSMLARGMRDGNIDEVLADITTKYGAVL